jgi:hypothetical protein
MKSTKDDAAAVMKELIETPRANTASGIARRLGWFKYGEERRTPDNHRVVTALQLLQNLGLVDETPTANGSKWGVVTVTQTQQN